MDLIHWHPKLQVPRMRSGEFKTELFERYQRNEQAFLALHDGDGGQWGLYTQSHRTVHEQWRDGLQVLCVRCHEAAGS